MTLRHLRIFVSVYEHMNITRAATVLHMTQPAVSRMIRELEDYYNVQFFERINRRLYSTDAGKIMYEHAAQILNQFNSLESSIRDTNHTFTLNIGSTFSLGSFILPAAIDQIQQMYPSATVRGHVYNAGTLQGFLQKGLIDFALIEDYIDDPALSSELFFEDKMVLVLPVGHPLTQTEDLVIRDLENQPLLVREQESAGRRRVEETFAQHGITFNPLLVSCSTQAIIRSVQQGLGIALLPWHLVKNDLTNHNIVSRPISDEPMSRSNYIFWHKDKIRSCAVIKAIDICREIAAASN